MYLLNPSIFVIETHRLIMEGWNRVYIFGHEKHILSIYLKRAAQQRAKVLMKHIAIKLTGLKSRMGDRDSRRKKEERYLRDSMDVDVCSFLASKDYSLGLFH